MITLSTTRTRPCTDYQDPIQCWQEQAGPGLEPQHHGVIASLVKVCVDLLSCPLQQSRAGKDILSNSGGKVLRRCLSLLRLWASGYGAITGELGQTVLVILNPLCKTLAKALQKRAEDSEQSATARTLINAATELCDQTRYLLSDTCDSSNDSNSDSDCGSSDPEPNEKADDFVRDVKTYMDNLLDLGAALDCPALEPHHEDTLGLVNLEPRSANGYHTELIRVKFPQAKVVLLQCLGEASWDRYQRMQKEREVNAQQDPALLSNAKSDIGTSEFQDSGLGTSINQAPSAYAETIMSFSTSISAGQHVTLPPLPAEAKKELSFECNACGKHIRATNNREWRRHLYADLRPYTCLFNDCSFTKEPFASIRSWRTHLGPDHKLGPDWHSIECPLCREATPTGRSTILDRFTRHMEDIALASLPRDVKSEADTDSEVSSLRSSLQSEKTQLTRVPLRSPTPEAQITQPAVKADVAFPTLDTVNESEDKTQKDAGQATRLDQLNKHDIAGLTELFSWDAFLTTIPETYDEEQKISTTKCICGFTGDDGNLVLCRSCGTRQHVACYYETAKYVPVAHECTGCSPRLIDSKKAFELQCHRIMTRQGLQGPIPERLADGTLSCSVPGCDQVWLHLSDCFPHVRTKHGNRYTNTSHAMWELDDCRKRLPHTTAENRSFRISDHNQGVPADQDHSVSLSVIGDYSARPNLLPGTEKTTEPLAHPSSEDKVTKITDPLQTDLTVPRSSHDRADAGSEKLYLPLTGVGTEVPASPVHITKEELNHLFFQATTELANDPEFGQMISGNIYVSPTDRYADFFDDVAENYDPIKSDQTREMQPDDVRIPEETDKSARGTNQLILADSRSRAPSPDDRSHDLIPEFHDHDTFVYFPDIRMASDSDSSSSSPTRLATTSEHVGKKIYNWILSTQSLARHCAQVSDL